MGLLNRLRKVDAPTSTPPARPAQPAVKVTLHAMYDAYSFTADDGRKIWAVGFTVLDEDTGAYVTLHDQRFRNPHCLLCRIAGTTHRPRALQDERFGPGHAVSLRLEPDNPYDGNAVSVWDAAQSMQGGFVPAEHSERIAKDLRAGVALGGVVLREFRRPKNGPRLGLHMLIVPAGTLELVIDEGDGT